MLRIACRITNIPGIYEVSLLPFRGEKVVIQLLLNKKSKWWYQFIRQHLFTAHLLDFMRQCHSTAQLGTVPFVQCGGACNARPKPKPSEQFVSETGMRGMLFLLAICKQLIKLHPQYQHPVFSRERRWQGKNGVQLEWLTLKRSL